MPQTSTNDFDNTSCYLNTRDGQPILAIYRMNGAKVTYSIGIYCDGTAVHIDKNTGKTTIYPNYSKEAKESRQAVKQEWDTQKIDIPPMFTLTMAL